MSDIIENDTGALAERPTSQVAIQPTGPDALLAIAVQRGASVEELERLLALKERVDAAAALRAHNEAFAAFKREAVAILRNKKVTDGPLKGKAYAELHSVVSVLTPLLSKHGLSAAWKLTKDEKDWLEVTCYLRHIGGHVESCSMGGPPDTGGAKNAIQARASTKSYLERYTLKAICGVAEQDDDDDGNGGKGNGPAATEAAEKLLSELTAGVQKTTSHEAALKFWKENGAKFKAQPGFFDRFTAAVVKHRQTLPAKEAE
jgi:hypothetical protein